MYLDEIKVGTCIEVPEVSIREEQMLEFARLYDPIPLHLDPDYASGTRFGGLIAPGVMSFMSVWAQFVRLGLFGEQLVAGKSTKIEWFKPVYPGDVLRGKVHVTEVAPRNSYNGIVTVLVEVYNQNGELVLTDVTESVVERRV